MTKPKDAQRVRLRPSGWRDGVTCVWDVIERRSGIVLGDVRRMPAGDGGNPYTAWLPGTMLGYFDTRAAAVTAVVEEARSALAEATP